MNRPEGACGSSSALPEATARCDIFDVRLVDVCILSASAHSGAPFDTTYGARMRSVILRTSDVLRDTDNWSAGGWRH
jgi:hypothetical protein